MKTLFPQQQESVQILTQALQRHGAALCGSDTGTGKTLTAVETCRMLNVVPLVVAPKAVLTAWEREFNGQGVPFLGVVGYEKLRAGNTKWLVKQKAKFTWNLPAGTVVIWDEVHRCKSYKSQNAAMLASCKAQGLRPFMLSATPFQDPTEMKATGYCLGLHTFTDFYSWALRNGCSKDNWNRLVFNPARKNIVEELSKKIYPSRGHFLRREDLGAHFAKCAVSWDPVDFGADAIANAYAEVSDQLDDLAERIASDGAEPISLVEILRARQKVELIKVPVISDMIGDHLDSGMSVFVALNFRASLEALQVKYPDAAIICGGQTQKERQASIDAFQSGATRVCLANIAAGGVGVSLHDEHGTHPRVALISPSFSAIELQQALGRVDRVGAKTPSVQKILVAAGTIEERICAILQKKLSLFALTKREGDANLQHTSATMTSDSTISSIPATKPQDGNDGHARFSPSQLKYFHKCPGYGPNNTENEAAVIGTRIHAALETDDDSKLASEWENWMAAQCRLSILGIIRRHGLQNATDLREVRLAVNAGTFSTYGTCDRLFIKGTAAVAADYKTGRGKIDDAEENWQCFAYTSGIFQKYPDVQTVDFYFITPQRNEISHAHFTRRELGKLLRDIDTVLATATHVHGSYWDKGIAPPPDVLRQDKDVCRFCRFAERCPKNRALAAHIAVCYKPDIVLPEAIHGSDNDSPEQIALMMKVIPIVEAWASGVKKKAKYMAIEQGIELPGFEVSTRAGKRTITDAAAAFSIASERGVTAEQFLSAIKSVPVGDFEDLIAGTAPRGTKQSVIESAMADLYAKGGLKVSDETHTLSEIR